MIVKFFEQLSCNLNELFKNSDEYNVIIEVGQAPNVQTFKAHSIILNSRCSYFKNKLCSIAYNDEHIKIINQNNVSIEVFDIIIKYIYGGTISLEKVNNSVVFELLIASSEFGLEELIKHIQTFLVENHSSWLRRNFPRVYNTSFENNNLKDLQQFCANIIAKHPNIVFDSNEFLTLSENVLIFVLKLYNLQIDEGKIWDYTIRWGIAQNPSLSSNPDQWSDEHFSVLKNTLQNCLPLIHYLQISDEDIIEKVRPYQKILDPTLWTNIQNKNIIVNIFPPRIYLPATLPSRDDKAPKIKSIKASELRESGKTYFTIGKYENSLIDLTKSIEIEPDNANTLRFRGETYRMLQRYNESLADLNKSLEIEPNDAASLRSRGNTYRMMGKYEESVADLNKSLRIEPNNTFALIIRADTYHMMDKYENSLADLNVSLKIEPNNAFALKNRGDTYRMMNRYEESLRDLNRSLEIDPNNALALRTRGDVYRLVKRYNESLVDLNLSLTIDPNNEDALSWRGVTYRMMGKYKESLVDLDRSLEIDPNNEWAVSQRKITSRLIK